MVGVEGSAVEGGGSGVKMRRSSDQGKGGIATAPHHHHHLMVLVVPVGGWAQIIMPAFLDIICIYKH